MSAEVSGEQTRRRRRRSGRGRRRNDSGGTKASEQEPMAPLPEDAEPMDHAARRIGIPSLHEEQRSGIDAALTGEDVLLVMPTGFGKSACYQVPSMLLPKPTVVISPLLALLRDQHEKLIKYEVPCVRIDGTVRGKKREAAIEQIRQGGSLLVMTTPESLANEEISGALQESGIALRPSTRRIVSRSGVMISARPISVLGSASAHWVRLR